MKLLIANRGEISVRVAQAAQDLDISTVAVFPNDDAGSLHTRQADEAVELPGRGVSAYLDADAIIDVARSKGCDLVHPGYGFLSESDQFAEACESANLRLVGPTPQNLKLFGNKATARRFAKELNINVPSGLDQVENLTEIEDFYQSLPSGRGLLLKAVHGGGGRGMRQVWNIEDLPNALNRAQSEAKAAFGSNALYVEELLSDARHIELQIFGDGEGNAIVLGDRDCSLQRRHQKIVEIAPAPNLSDEIRKQLWQSALQLAEACNYRSLLTVEFLVSGSSYYFIEANARIQVEHTITEESIGIDLVQSQLRFEQGESLDSLFDSQLQQPRYAIQCRVNMERMEEDGATKPAGGTLHRFSPPFGPNVRVDTYGYVGYTTNPNFDSLLAKVISSGQTYKAALNRSRDNLTRFDIQGVETNRNFLVELLEEQQIKDIDFHTRFVDDVIPNIVKKLEERKSESTSTQPQLAGIRVQSKDPLAVLDLGKEVAETIDSGESSEIYPDSTPVPDGTVAVLAPMQGTVVEINTSVGESVFKNDVVVVMEAMKMEHEIKASATGEVHSLNVNVGDAVYQDHALMFLAGLVADDETDQAEDEVDLATNREDVEEVIYRHEITLDKNRPDAIEKRRKTHQRTARENIDDLCDEDSFIEHGQLAVTPGTGLPFEEAIRKFPTDGMITGVGSINGEHFDLEASRSVVMAYDYTVLAGTQGAINHPKTDRMLELAEKWEIPVVLFAEGGGGRAGTGGKREGGESTTNAGQGRIDAAYRPLDTPTFASMGRLSGLVPLIGVTSRYCFAGNASLLGCCDVIIATENSNIGMGGPALIEGGNLGVFRPEEVGPVEVQRANGVIDIVTKDEEEAVSVAKQYLSYFQGRNQRMGL